jgi:hypothetical protein
MPKSPRGRSGIGFAQGRCVRSSTLYAYDDPALLVISGMPGAGKTYYTKDLERRGWIRIEYDEAWGRPPRDELDTLWLLAQREPTDEHIAAFVEAADRVAQPVVLEFGFVMSELGVIASLQRHHAAAWWFTGDRSACLRDWQEAHPNHPEIVCVVQMDAIDRELPLIEATYGANTLKASAASGHLTLEQIDAAIGLDRFAPR